jgi:hypothetical protein
VKGTMKGENHDELSSLSRTVVVPAFPENSRSPGSHAAHGEATRALVFPRSKTGRGQGIASGVAGCTRA